MVLIFLGRRLFWVRFSRVDLGRYTFKIGVNDKWYFQLLVVIFEEKRGVVFIREFDELWTMFAAMRFVDS